MNEDYIENPEAVVAEIYRVLESDGIAVAYDNDWGVLSLNSPDMEFTRMVEDEWRYSFTNPWIGRHLRLFFIRTGSRA